MRRILLSFHAASSAGTAFRLGSLATLAVLGASASLFASCTDVNPEVDPPFDAISDGWFDVGLAEPNRCGGPSELLFEGAVAAPGDACGACNDGVIVCLGADQLQCVGASVPNVCGGCSPLPGGPGGLCGACGFGVLACDGENALSCTDDRETNACGGCQVLPADPGEACGTETEPASWICSSPEDLSCVAAGQNACGGSSSLDAIPGTLCGDCGRGFLSCFGQDAVVCEDEQAGVNSCGGCSRLPAEPGTACGDCGGFYECTVDGELACNRERNACGGCGVLAGTPGNACGNGNTWVCTVGANVQCAAEGRNVCGGFTDLESPAGTACGECDDGMWTCVDPESTACLRATERNACGSCGPLAGEPGQPCSASAVFVCVDGIAVCESAIDVNACGGSTQLGAALGTPCGLCETGRLACSGTESLQCEGEADPESLRWYLDEDEDGFYAEGAASEVLCEIPDPGYTQVAGDCDDEDALTYPGAEEDACVDMVDRNCDGENGFVDVDEDGVSACFDCDDGNRRVQPGAAEQCDGIDNDCDGERDEGALRVFYLDADGDGFGDVAQTTEACEVPDGYAVAAGDCDDGDSLRNPDAVERCDGIDNRCDGNPDPPTAIDAVDWFPDADGDGFGDALGTPVVACEAPEAIGWASNAGDCNDGDDTISPGASELCDGIDNNCDRVVDTDADDLQRRWVDADGDGYGDPDRPALACPQSSGFADNDQDCNDGRGDTWPDAPERVGDAVDQDCDREELCYVDADGDGYVGDFALLVSTPDLSCSSAVPCPEGAVSSTGDGLCFLSPGLSGVEDCDDTTPLRAPGLVDTFGDGIDSNCDGVEVCYRDLDGDGYSPSPDAIVLSSDADCDDPGEITELARLGGTDCWDASFDAGTGTGCEDVSGGVDPLVCPNMVNPGALDEPSRPIDGVDYDCNGSARCYVDGDEDSYRSGVVTDTDLGVRGVLEACNVENRSTVYTQTEFDWCDGDATIHPGFAESNFDGVDRNCDGEELCYVDRDRDLWRADSSNADEQILVSCTPAGCARQAYSGEPAPVALPGAPRASSLCATEQGMATLTTLEGDCVDTDTNISPGEGVLDVPDSSPSDPGVYFDTNCDGRDGDAGWDQYVNCDSADRPEDCAVSLRTAVSGCITRLVEDPWRPCTVYVERGEYDLDGNTLQVAPGTFQLSEMRIAGGYNEEFTTRRYGRNADGWSAVSGFGEVDTQATVINGATPVVELSGTDAAFNLSGLRVSAAPGGSGVEASPNGRPSVGIFAGGVRALVVERSFVSGATGGVGFGAAGERGTSAGNSGGFGGSGGEVTSSNSTGSGYEWTYFNAGIGGRGRGEDGGAGGSAGTYDYANVCDGSNCDEVNEGAAQGGAGASGADGRCAAAPSASPVWPSTMADGSRWETVRSDGTNGASGSGGGGGGGSATLVCLDSDEFGCGSGGLFFSQGGIGGRGGDGGGGGLGGVGGGHGGPSIAIALHNTVATLRDLRLRTNPGGRGANGQDGSTGGRGNGGAAGVDGINDPGNGWTIPGYAGGTGGAGGAGGGGSGGAGGHGGASVPLLLSGTSTASQERMDITDATSNASRGAGGAGGSRGSNPTGGPCTAASGPNGVSGVSYPVGYNLSTGLEL